MAALKMETTDKMLLKRKLNFVKKLNSNPYTRTLINRLIEETKRNEEKISKKSILSELEGIFSCEIRNSEELSKLWDSKVKEMCRESKELEKDGIIESLRFCLNSNLANKKNKQILELLTKSY
ncbi:hypothetical protein BpHYR1_049028 [Brachionus plicatilis]|uniref:Uncharacterized protein n=1 Tax=Brachionus plicatilis TaxID=10195 RepID=A0A3M7S5Y2_BRAPC|nr:hypothetical protein BpHYR1_049028 [Brachionus plicatilis]